MAKDWKDRLGTVYSTNPDYSYNYDEEEEQKTLAPQQQNLIVCLDKKQRKGKTVTLITGFIGADEDLKDLGKKIKTKCGTGGSVKNGEIIIQGNLRTKIYDFLVKEAYKVKESGK